MSAREIKIVSAALALLGVGPIQSFEEGTPAANSAALIWPVVKSQCLYCHPWRFTFKKRKLARLNETPVNEWTYAFQLPADSITMPRAVFTSGNVGAPKTTDFEIYEGKLLSDYDEIWIDYQFEPAAEVWPEDFANLAVHALAAMLAIPMTGDKSRAEMFNEKAWGLPGEYGMGGLFAVARRTDSFGLAPRSLLEDGGPLLAARRGAR